MDDNKKSTTIWLRPSVISRMDGWLEADNCQSRSEFVDKALRFYMGYLGTEDNTTYISRAILTAIQGTLDDNNNRLCRILFKCAVELNMLCHTIAAHFRADPIHTRELRAYAVDEVKRTNGQVSFESAASRSRPPSCCPPPGCSTTWAISFGTTPRLPLPTVSKSTASGWRGCGKSASPSATSRTIMSWNSSRDFQ